MGGVKVGMDAATGYDKASLNLAEIQAGRAAASSLKSIQISGWF